MLKRQGRSLGVALLTALTALVLVTAGCAPGATTAPTPTAPPKATTAPQGTTAPAAPPTVAPTKPPAAAAKEPLKIGLVGSASGYASAIGGPQRDGVTLVEEEINKAGGINGYPVKVTAYDDESDETKSVLAMKKLVNDDKVLAVIGGAASGIVMATIPVVEEAGVTWVTQGSSDTLINPPKKWVFKTAPGESLQLIPLLDYLKSKGWTKFGFLSQAAGFGREGRKAMEQYAPKLGLTAVAKEEYNPTDTDIKPQLTRIKAANPDAIVVFGAEAAGAIAMGQARQLGFTGPVLGNPGFTSVPILQVKEILAGMEGAIFSNPKPQLLGSLPDSDPQKKAIADLDKLMRAKYGTKYAAVDFSLAQAYDAFNLLAKAIKIANPDPSNLAQARGQIRDGMEKVGNHIGAFGLYNMTAQDHMGYSPSSFVLVELKGGNLVMLK